MIIELLFKPNFTALMNQFVLFDYSSNIANKIWLLLFLTKCSSKLCKVARCPKQIRIHILLNNCVQTLEVISISVKKYLLTF